jgi:hypothetical protein
MRQIDIIAMITPVFAGLVVIVTAFVVTYFDDKAAKAERKARLSSPDHSITPTASAAE